MRRCEPDKGMKKEKEKMTKIDIVSGFLGAGKTTLIKKLIQEAFEGEKLVLIENEFGEIGIDGGFLKDSGINITEMNSGCICCSLVGDFGTALGEVLEKYSPDRIIIEPSGVGKLSDVIKAVLGVKEKLPEEVVKLNSSVTVADASKCKMYMKNFGEFYNNQVEHADTIVLSRTQNMDQTKLETAVKLLQDKNTTAAIITTPWDELDGEIILKAMNQRNSMVEEMLEEHHHEHECGCGHHHHEDGEECHEGHHHEHGEECGCEHHHHEHGHHHADEVFTSWGKETPHKYSEADLKEILEKLANGNEYGMILRAKGIISGEDGEWMQFDLVPGEYEIRKSSPDYTGRLCVIGSELEFEKLEKLFHLA